MRLVALAGLLAVSLPSLAEAETKYKTITFPSSDGVTITADLYTPHAKTATMIVLFHQAGWSRGEYRDIAVKLGELGFNALAVDARSGRKVAGVKNETAAAAKKAKKKTSYVDALVDLRAALKFARANHADGKVVAWGSSYSAGLVLVLAGTEPELADATLAFAPGEYYSKHGKSKAWVRESAKGIKMPVFITAAKSETGKWNAIFAAIPDGNKSSFIPKTKGNHGSKALWSKYKDSKDYWAAVEKFLKAL